MPQGRFCTNCGQAIPEDAAFCAICGAPAPEPARGVPGPARAGARPQTYLSLGITLLVLAAWLWAFFSVPTTPPASKSDVPSAGAARSIAPALQIKSATCSAIGIGSSIFFEIYLSGERTGSASLQKPVFGRAVREVKYPTSLRFKVESADRDTDLADGVVLIPGEIEIGQQFKATGRTIFSGTVPAGKTAGHVTLVEPEGCGTDCIAGSLEAACQWKGAS